MREPDDEDAPPPRLFSTAFWVALALGLALTAAGAVIGLYGARLFPSAHGGPPAHGRGL
jgi:hypothetical protein